MAKKTEKARRGRPASIGTIKRSYNLTDEAIIGIDLLHAGTGMRKDDLVLRAIELYLQTPEARKVLSALKGRV